MNQCITQFQTMKHCDTGQTFDERVEALTDMVMDNRYTVESDDGLVKINRETVVKQLSEDGDAKMIERILLTYMHRDFANGHAQEMDFIRDEVHSQVESYVHEYEGDKF